MSPSVETPPPAGRLSPAQIEAALAGLRDELAAWVSWPTESQNPDRRAVLADFLADMLSPRLGRMGFACSTMNAPGDAPPFLVATRIEDASRPTLLLYGHGDVIRGQDDAWQEGLSPWTLTERSGRWYGRGTADNKGQMSINLAALDSRLQRFGRLGFNVKYLIEMGEEVGSPGLRQFCADHRDRLAADVLIASDGPRVDAETPTIFLGSRASATFDLVVEGRPSAHHSGNFGGIISDPVLQLAHALASIASSTGRIEIPEWRPAALAAPVRAALAGLALGRDPDSPALDEGWGEPGLTRAEQLYAWCSFDVLAMIAGDPARPVNAIPGQARARCQLRYVPGIDPAAIVPGLRRHLDAHGFGFVDIRPTTESFAPATGTRLDSPWAAFVADSIRRSTGKPVRVLPGLGGTLPNDAFAHVLGLDTVWIPHSYPACSQHAPDEHVPVALVREAFVLMEALFADLAAGGPRHAGAEPDPDVQRKGL